MGIPAPYEQLQVILEDQPPPPEFEYVLIGCFTRVETNGGRLGSDGIVKLWDPTVTRGRNIRVREIPSGALRVTVPAYSKKGAKETMRVNSMEWSRHGAQSRLEPRRHHARGGRVRFPRVARGG